MEKNIYTKYNELEKAYKVLESKYRVLSMEHSKTLKDFDNYKKETEEIIKKNVEIQVTKAIKEISEQLESKYIKIIQDLEKENTRLKALANTDSNTSGIPTSQTKIGNKKRIPNSREKSDKTLGGQKGHIKHTLRPFNDDEITEEIVVPLPICSCGGAIENIQKITKDVLDYKIITTKTRYNFHKGNCSSCGKEICSEIPNNMKAECSYGENVKALSLMLINDTNAPYNKVRKLITGFTENEINISEGYLVSLQKKASNKLEYFLGELKSAILKEKILHWDDTVIKIDKNEACFRFYGNERYALYKAHEHKNKDGMDEDGIFVNLTKDTVLVHDHLKSNYNKVYEFINAECNAHSIRELKKIIYYSNRKWADDMIRLLTEANVTENRDEEYVVSFDERYQKILEEGEIERLSNIHQNNDNDEKNLIKRLKEYEENYTLFVRDEDVPFTNNVAERSLRGSKSKMKVSGQFKNVAMAKCYASIRSYIETCIRHLVNPYSAIVRLLDDNPYTILQLQEHYKTHTI